MCMFIMNLFNYNLKISSLFAFKRIVLEKMNKQQYKNMPHFILIYEYIPKQQPHKYFHFYSFIISYFWNWKYLATDCEKRGLGLEKQIAKTKFIVVITLKLSFYNKNIAITIIECFCWKNPFISLVHIEIYVLVNK